MACFAGLHCTLHTHRRGLHTNTHESYMQAKKKKKSYWKLSLTEFFSCKKDQFHAKWVEMHQWISMSFRSN